MTIVEIGANYGQHTYDFINTPGANVFCFEPVPYLFSILKEKYGSFSNIEIINKAVCDFNGKATFGISNDSGGARDLGCSSLHEFTDNIESLWPNRPDFSYKEKIEVDVIRMDTFIIEKGIEKIDYLHCDAQGSDFAILKSFGDKISILKEGRVEASTMVSLYKVDNHAISIVKFLEEKGFEILNMGDLYSENSYEIDLHFKNKI